MEWRKNGGVLLIGYEMFRTLVSSNCKESLAKQKNKSKNKPANTIIDLDEEESKFIRLEGELNLF